MPKTSRSRVLAADPEAVWRIAGDPGKLARWWPKVERVDRPAADQFVKWLTSARGRAVPMSFRLIESEPGVFACWEQELEGSPFERSVRRSRECVRVEPAAEGTSVVLSIKRSLKGSARLGAPLVARGQRIELESALDRLQERFGG